MFGSFYKLFFYVTKIDLYRVTIPQQNICQRLLNIQFKLYYNCGKYEKFLSTFLLLLKTIGRNKS